MNDEAVWIQVLTGNIVLYSWAIKPLHSTSASIHPGVQKQFYQDNHTNFKLR